ncbi:MAG: hypothetical protein ACRDC4_12235 [Plesiomonas sp.]
MPADVYLSRMGELDSKNEQKVIQMFPDLSKPSPLKPGEIKDLNANLAPPKPEDVQAEMDSGFGISFNEYSNRDVRFGQMMEDYKQLAGVLKQKVDRGFMPPQIAEMQLKRFLNDGRGYFAKNKAGPMDNPELRGALEGALAQAYEGGQQGPQGAPQQAPMPGQVQPMPAPQQAPEGAPMPPQGGM